MSECGRRICALFSCLVGEQQWQPLTGLVTIRFMIAMFGPSFDNT